MGHLEVLIGSFFEPRSWFLAAFVAGAAYYQYWSCRGLYWLAQSGRRLKNNVTAIGREFRRWKPDVETAVWMNCWVLRNWDLQDLHLSVRSRNDEEFECFQLKAFFLIQTFLREMRECICSPICFTLTIINLKMITRELLGLKDLTRAQTLCIHELSEVIIVSENKDFVFAVF